MHTCKRRLPSLILILPLATFAAMPHGLAESARPVLPVRAPVPQAAPAPPLPQPSPANTTRTLEQAAIPTPRPQPDASQQPERPMFGPPMLEPRSQAAPVPAAVPVPPTRPDRAAANPPAGEMFGPPAPKMLPDKRSNAERPATMPADETACRVRLKQLGAEFEEAAPQSNADGCALPFPLKLKRLSAAVDIAPDALINCAAAEASARFTANVIAPAAKAEFGEELATVDQASAYVCRPRNGTRKLSEHAFGNALDIARFTLSKGTAIDVEPAPPAQNARFLSRIREAACGPFKTVLGPGSDADHALHFHFDLAPRRNGGTFCQ
ncbi:extensin family protein [Aminobacter sp. DSM 101952]|uniref:extensin-like domain-containing protein n=1 Tax=Aminobacter sp. DSM 101952 TaxID=2735891 RepID=UPI0006F9F04B|nr:extensin family protein [Aminobacter sp. DSM 101952]KQU76572.1 extensin family protein [Aminobacter sp. DSM 101952]